MKAVAAITVLWNWVALVSLSPPLCHTFDVMTEKRHHHHRNDGRRLLDPLRRFSSVRVAGSPPQTETQLPSFPRTRRTRLLATPPLDPSPSPKEDGLDKKSSSKRLLDPDQRRRRQILLSMLAGTGVTSTLTAFASVAKAKEMTLDQPPQISEQPVVVTDQFMNVIVPPLDDNQYLAYTLDNGMRILLCSDPSTNEAAVAMDVHVGACADPVQVPGMAHFHEHMLFLGTKSYPQEDSFESFLSTNGGSSNAYTDSLDTVYFFDMAVDADARFAEGLKRFGSFFSEPLFTETGMCDV